MTNEQRYLELAKIGYESAQDAFGADPDGLPPAHVVWSFLLSNAGCELIEDPALDVWLEDSAPEDMPVAFGRAYDALAAERAA